MVLAWRIYYDDGSTFDSSQGEPDDAHPWGVVGVVFRDAQDPRTLHILKGVDYYCHVGSAWIGHDVVGILDCLAHRIPLRGFLVGRWIGNYEFKAFEAIMQTDPDLWGPHTAEELASGGRRRS